MPHKDPDQRRAYYARWKQGEKKRRSNKFHDAAKHANDRAAKYGVPGRLTAADVRAVLGVGAPCSYCDNPGTDLDHVVAMARGGPNTLDNLQATCKSCNASKYRGDKPGRWARDHDACVHCGRTDSRHRGFGQCQRCWFRAHNKDGTLR